MGIRMFLDLASVQGKIEWEGGLYATAYEYGMSHEVIDPDALPELREAWKAMDEAFREHFGPALDRVDKLLYGDM